MIHASRRFITPIERSFPRTRHNFSKRVTAGKWVPGYYYSSLSLSLCVRTYVRIRACHYAASGAVNTCNECNLPMLIEMLYRGGAAAFIFLSLLPAGKNIVSRARINCLRHFVVSLRVDDADSRCMRDWVGPHLALDF